MLLGLLTPDGGTIKGLEGKRISAVFQEDRLCEPFSALENVRLVTAKKADTEQILQELAALDLPEEWPESRSINCPAGRDGGSLWRGQWQRKRFRCLDEPFKGLDKETKQKAMEYVKERGKGKNDPADHPRHGRSGIFRRDRTLALDQECAKKKRRRSLKIRRRFLHIIPIPGNRCLVGDSEYEEACETSDHWVRSGSLHRAFALRDSRAICEALVASSSEYRAFARLILGFTSSRSLAETYDCPPPFTQPPGMP